MVDKQTARQEHLEAWRAFLEKQTVEFGKSTVDRWLATLQILPSKGRTFCLLAKDMLSLNWFEEHIRPKLSTTFLDNEGEPIPVDITIYLPKRKRRTPLAIAAQPSLNWLQADPNKTFSSFTLQEENRLSVEFLIELANTKKAPFNPIYLWGPTQSGKSHLLNALVNAFPQKEKVIFTTGELFTEHVVNAMRSFDMKRFRQAYRSADCLIVDDIEELAHKGASQEEFFHTFNTLQMAGKPIILTARSLPHNLEGIEPRLISRFEWGIVFSLTPFHPIAQLTPLGLQAEAIVATVASFYEIQPSDILGKGQRREFSRPRQVAIFLCRELLAMPYKKIGKYFRRDHSTVITSIHTVQRDQKRLRQTLLTLKDRLLSCS